MDPEPQRPETTLLLALLPALLAAAYATVTASMASLSTARRSLLKDTTQGAQKNALERYLDAPERIEARWLWLRVIGVAATAALLTSAFRPLWLHAWLLGLGGSILAYAIPSELARPFATRRADSWIPQLLLWLRPLEWLVAPLADPISWFAQSLARREPARAPNATLLESEMEMIVTEGEKSGSLAHDQSEMIRNVLDFRDLTAEDIMVPRIQVDSIEATTPLREVLHFVATNQHSRYPIYSEHIDNVVGILHVRDLIAHITSNPDSTAQITELARKPVAFVPEGQPASMVLKDMRVGRHHLAVVIDEFGGVSGIVTLEDLLEEIVGDIQDEHDEDASSSRIIVIDKDRVLVDASLPVTDVNRHLGTELPEGDYISLGGLLLDRIGRVPPPGSQHDLLGLSVTIREADHRHIARVELSGVPTVPELPTGDISAA